MLVPLKQLFLILVGVAIGAAINYLGDQLPRKRRLSHPLCSHCLNPISPTRWVSLTRFFVGHCRCGNKTSLRSIIVELFFAMLLPLIDKLTPTNTHFIVLSLLCALFFLIMVIDIEHKLVLNSVVIPTTFIAFFYGMLTNNQDISKVLLIGTAGYMMMLLVFFGGKLYSKLMIKNVDLSSDVVTFGMGDVRLGGIIGLATGWPGLPQALVVTIISSGIVAITIRMSRNYKPFTMLPFSPFVIVGTLIAILFR